MLSKLGEELNEIAPEYLEYVPLLSSVKNKLTIL